jgi:thymidylate kinase
MSKGRESPVIGIVGVCGSGKTTLISRLKEKGISCHHIAQEHSYVQSMWQQLVDPDFLIYLDVSYESTVTRKKLNWTLQEYEEQRRRVQHARDHADLFLDTDLLTIDQEVERVLSGLKTAGIVTPIHGQKEPE